MDNSSFILDIRKHIASGHKLFPSNTPQLLKIVRGAIAEKTATPEQQAQLIALEAELKALSPPSSPSFPGSSVAAL